MELYIHIGAHKTGTTSLQDFLYENREELMTRHKILYPCSRTIGFKRNHTDLTSAIMSEDVKLGRMVMSRVSSSGMSREEFGERYVQEIVQDVEDNSPDTIVISTEAFFSKSSHFNWKKLISRLGVEERSVKFFCYLRDPSSHYLSLVQQRIKYSGSFKVPSPVPMRKFVDSYENEFPGKVSVRILENVGDTIQDFKNLLGIPEFEAVKLNVKQNESISPEAMSIAQDYRRMFFHDLDDVVTSEGRRFFAMLQDVDKSLEGFRKPQLIAEVVSVVNYQAKKDVGWLEEKYGLSIPWQVPDENVHQMCSVDSISDICEIDSSRKELLLLSLVEALISDGK